MNETIVSNNPIMESIRPIQDIMSMARDSTKLSWPPIFWKYKRTETLFVTLQNWLQYHIFRQLYGHTDLKHVFV